MERLLWMACVVGFLLAPWSVPAHATNIKTFGATGNGSTNDTHAFANAIASLPPAGGEIYIPAGTYKLTQTLTIANKSIAFRGDGQRASILRWDTPAGTHGIIFTSSTTANTTLTMSSLSLWRANASGGAAVWASWAYAAGSSAANGLVTASITDLDIAPFPLHSGLGWEHGLRFHNATSPKISNFAITGGGASITQTAISLEDHSIASYISAGEIRQVNRGIRTQGTSEGIHITSVEMQDVHDGIMLSGGPGTAIEGNFINATSRGIITPNWGDTSIANNTIVKSGWDNWVGIDIQSGENCRIIGNLIVGNAPLSPSDGIVLEGRTRYNIVKGNITRNVGTGIWLTSPSVTDNVIVGNLTRAYTGMPILNAGTANYIAEHR